MADAAEVQVSHFLDQHGLGAFQIKLIIWSVLLAMIDGYDIGAIAFAAPSLIKEWHIAPKELGLVLRGVIPILVALNAASAPRTLRATLAIIAVGLVPLGGALAGFAAAALVPQYGWQILFEIGGIVPVVFALAAIVTLPESIKFMTLHESHRGKMEALLAAIAPGYKVPPNARFVIEDEKQSPSSPIYLFGNGLAAITPLTWLMFACNLMGYFFL